jgi:hypothetical protein
MPFFSIDPEEVAEFYDNAGRKFRAMLREEPYCALGGSFFAGFLAGGGWKTHLGKFALLVVARHVAMRAAERYLVT